MPRLTELNARLYAPGPEGARQFSFDCPIHDGAHRILVMVHAQPYAVIDNVKHWQMSGEFPDSFSLTPSINCDVVDEQTGLPSSCKWHGHVSNGVAA